MRKLEWQRSEATERTLKRFGLDWKIEEVPFNQIDHEMSDNNHARRMRIDDSVVSDYLTAMEDGDDFPCGVAVKQPAGKYLVLGGNHTRKAAESFGAKSMDFYVINTKDPMVLDLLPKLLNRKHGLRKDREEAIQDAINAIAQYKLSIADAAEKFGVSAHTLEVNNRVTFAVRRFKKLGIKPDALDGMPRNAIVRLNTIPIDAVAEKAVKLAEKQEMRGPEVHALVDAIQENKNSVEEQIEVVKRFEAGLEQGKKVILSKGTELERLWARYTRLLTTLNLMLRNKKNLRQMGCKAPNEAIITLHKELSARLHALATEA